MVFQGFHVFWDYAMACYVGLLISLKHPTRTSKHMCGNHFFFSRLKAESKKNKLYI